MKRITALFLVLGVILVFACSCSLLKSLQKTDTKQGGIWYGGEIMPILVPADFPDVNPATATAMQIGMMTVLVVYQDADCAFVVYVYEFYVFAVIINLQTDNPRYWIYDVDGKPCEVTREAFEQAFTVWDATGPPATKQNTGIIL